MGVIYGYISLNGKPIDPAIPEAMRKANSFWDPDGDGLFTDEYAALGSLIMFNTPEAILEKQPIYFADNQKVLVATARIDNRDDLCRVFDIPLSARDIYPDSYYIRLAYEKWGEACADHLIGDWSFAVYDKITRKLFIARDHHGIMACYYYQGPDFFVFSSSLKGILCLPQVEKKVNEYKIAQLLVNWNEGGPQTCYLDIFRLPPAHTLSLENNKVITNRYWYLENTPEIKLKNDQEYIDMFRDLYTEAVRCRLRSYRPVGATLSGGLDSGSVCILASQELAKYGKRLPAFTAVPLYDVPWPKNRIGDEGPLAMALAEKLGNVDVTLCNSENINALESLNLMMKIHDEPDFLPVNSYWITDIITKSKEKNIASLLIGQNGNNTITWRAYNFKTYLTIISHLCYSYLIFKKINNTFLINKAFLEQSGIKNHIVKNKNFVTVLKPNYQRRHISISNGFNNGHRWFCKGLYFKTEFRDPTFDHLLVNFYLATSQHKNDIGLFRENFKSFFSEAILLKKLKGIQSADIRERIDYDILIKSIEALYTHKNAIINKEYLNKLLVDIRKLEINTMNEILRLSCYFSFIKEINN